MSYNLDNIKILDGELFMKAEDIRELQDELKTMNPAEVNFLDDFELDDDDSSLIVLDNIWWFGEGSGHTYEEIFIGKIMPKIIGEANIMEIWEGGDTVETYRLVNGKKENIKQV